MLRPIQMIWDRVERGRQDSDTALFMDLLYAGEMVLRLTVAGFVAAVQEDRERHQYRLLHRIVRADGIGDWSQTLDDVLTGAASQHLAQAARDDRRDLLERLGADSWQYQSVVLLHDVLKLFQKDIEALPPKGSLRSWFSMFPVLRNKTRGHGAPTAAICSRAAPTLEKSIRLISDNALIFQRPWAYLHRNLSGKYRVVSLGNDVTAFDRLKTNGAKERSSSNLSDGIYINFDDYVRVALVETTVDTQDFFFPNGNFNSSKYELHSLLTDSRQEADSTLYLAPASERPSSETEGKSELDIIGNVLSNLPPGPSDYVSRPVLEFELLEELRNDRHSIITLVGQGGIGKTSLALKVLHAAAQEGGFDFIFWFSARDIDLLPVGPKVVRPHVLTERDIADEFVQLLSPPERESSEFRAVPFLSSCMSSTRLGGKSIFVFDNFETVRSPLDLFNWIDTNIRLPNKALITSRFREFRADYPIDIGGMERNEVERLIDQVAGRLGVEQLIDESYRESIFEDSNGHPYVIKIIIGEIADTKKTGRPERIIARKDEILDALFERTYANLSPAAKRVFLTLCGWRSFVPQLALEAVLLRPSNDRMDVAAAVDELTRMSLVERNKAADGTDFLNVPLAATLFGQRKLSASAARGSIEVDLKMLQDIGPTSETRLKDGIAPRMTMLFERIAGRISEGKASIEEMRPILEVVARDYSPGWLLLADIYEEAGGSDALHDAAECVRRFLEGTPDPTQARQAWSRLAEIYERLGDIPGASDAQVRAIEFSAVPFSAISNAANWLNIHRPMLSEQESSEREELFKRVIRLMENRIREASATDLSRLAWMYLPRGTERAQQLAAQGLSKEPGNSHCIKLAERLRT